MEGTPEGFRKGASGGISEAPLGGFSIGTRGGFLPGAPLEFLDNLMKELQKDSRKELLKKSQKEQMKGSWKQFLVNSRKGLLADSRKEHLWIPERNPHEIIEKNFWRWTIEWNLPGAHFRESCISSFLESSWSSFLNHSEAPSGNPLWLSSANPSEFFRRSIPPSWTPSFNPSRLSPENPPKVHAHEVLFGYIKKLILVVLLEHVPGIHQGLLLRFQLAFVFFSGNNLGILQEHILSANSIGNHRKNPH